jgi:hypothetical protein
MDFIQSSKKLMNPQFGQFNASTFIILGFKPQMTTRKKKGSVDFFLVGKYGRKYKLLKSLVMVFILCGGILF